MEVTMTTLTRWNPFRQMSRFDPFVDVDKFARGMGLPAFPKVFEEGLEMRMDVSEDDQAYRVRIEIPGVRKKDIDVSITGNQVSVSAEVRREKKQEKEREIYSERYVGQASRSFTLPAEVDADKAEARYDDGVLELTLPKKANGNGRRLQVD
jgi:HSP20 family protein